jgi:hypothetical protein
MRPTPDPTRTPFLYFPLKNHFEQKFHIAHSLDQYDAGRQGCSQTSFEVTTSPA